MPTYTGRVRSIVLPVESYEKHRKVVDKYLDGHKVETYIGHSTRWLHVINPNFDWESEYRIADDATRILPGQKWRHKKTPSFRVTVTGIGLGVVHYQDLHQYLHYCSFEEFYARYVRIPG